MAGRSEQVPRLLGLVAALVEELHPGRLSAQGPELDDALERDLGLDSLARMELLARLEAAFGVEVPEEGLVTAETPRDLLGLLTAAPAAGAVQAAGGPAAGPGTEKREEGAVAAPDTCATLLEVVDWHARRHPERVHLTFLHGDGAAEELTYGELDRRSRTAAAGLRDLGLAPGRAVGLMLPSGLDYFACFLGAVRAGGVPVPLYPPLRPSQVEDHLLRQAGILATSQAELLITFPQVLRLARLVRGRVEGLRRVVAASEVLAAGEAVGTRPGLPAVHAADTAFLQFTSGSTGDPKGVILSHADLLANLRIMGRTAEVGPGDRLVSWLPLYHDMGLIGAWMGTLYFGLPLILMSPLTFLARPVRWLEVIHRFRGTISAAPNFAYELCTAKIRDEEMEGLDLSGWRVAMSGAEPVSPETVHRFTERFARWGFRPEALTPVYGLAECSLGLTFTPPGRGPRIDRVQRRAFLAEGRAVPVGEDDPQALEIVSCGRPLAGYDLRLVDEKGGEAGERRQGRLLFRGPSTTAGYFRNPEATRRLFEDGWLDSGDLAYRAEGEIYLTGRTKDLILRAGRNLHPQEVEQAVGDVPGVRKGCVAAFGVADPASGTERLVVLAETRERGPEALGKLQRRVEEATLDRLGVPADEVVMVPPHTVLKTSSGKIRRAATRARWESERLGARPRAVWWQVVRLGFSGLGPQLRRSGGAATGVVWAAWFWLLAGLAVGPVWLSMALMPGLERRRRLARLEARALARLLGIPLAVEGARHISEGARHLSQPAPRVVVANHAGYLDALVLLAALPAPLGAFVVKRELAGRAFTRVLLRRLGALFVERFDAARGVEDTRRARAAVEGGETLVFFPEGTFDWSPGLRAFRLGAFQVAVEAGVAVVPVTLAGTRTLLSRSRFPRRAPVTVTVGEPLIPQGGGWKAAVELRDAARRAILEGCGEVDLEG